MSAISFTKVLPKKQKPIGLVDERGTWVSNRNWMVRLDGNHELPDYFNAGWYSLSPIMVDLVVREGEESTESFPVEDLVGKAKGVTKQWRDNGKTELIPRLVIEFNGEKVGFDSRYVENIERILGGAKEVYLHPSRASRKAARFVGARGEAWLMPVVLPRR